jgi:hypothetical protein
MIPTSLSIEVTRTSLQHLTATYCVNHREKFSTRTPSHPPFSPLSMTTPPRLPTLPFTRQKVASKSITSVGTTVFLVKQRRGRINEGGGGDACSHHL